ncbi:hypothetical protein T492DRAFT_884559 [Pavlovales sp. CCMP2436]|nr:hypothetical protein T492DRAFT_884559 [Pavlovales sp. CCMP2436]
MASLAQLPALVLLVDGAHAPRWSSAVASLPASFSKLVHLKLAAVCADDATAARCLDDREVPFCFLDIEGKWARVRGVDAQGAVLVRSDGHVAWRGSPASDEEAAVSLASAVSHTLRHGLG